MSSYWEDPAFRSSTVIDWEEGTEIVGTVEELSTHVFPANERGPERVVPLVILDDGTQITCGPADLKKKMVAAAPAVGDKIKVTCVGANKTALGIQRFFTVKVQKAPVPNGPSLGPAQYVPPPAGVQDEVPF